MASQDIFLGKSFSYPLDVDVSGNAKRADGIKSVEQSMAEILATPLGSRFYNESWGSNLYLLTFEQNDAVLESLIRYFSVEAISSFEKRVKVVAVEFENVSEVQKNILIKYRLRASNEINTFVYPFYREINQ